MWCHRYTLSGEYYYNISVPSAKILHNVDFTGWQWLTSNVWWWYILRPIGTLPHVIMDFEVIPWLNSVFDHVCTIFFMNQVLVSEKITQYQMLLCKNSSNMVLYGIHYYYYMVWGVNPRSHRSTFIYQIYCHSNLEKLA